MSGLITFAIGDIHGCLQELESLLAICESNRAGRDARFMFIGDYIDRGPDPKNVIELLIERQCREPGRFVCLRGNHEQMLVDAADPERLDRDLINWWMNGGEQTLGSYQVNDPSAIPADHLAWIKTLPLKLVGAGLESPLARQSPPFLSYNNIRKDRSLDSKASMSHHRGDSEVARPGDAVGLFAATVESSGFEPSTPIACYSPW
jgi:Calcineurin-like phosphoesterase